MTWNWVDILALILVFRGAYVGYKEGLSVELVKLGTVFITYYCAIKYYARVALWITDHSRVPIDWATVLAFVAIAVAALILVWLFFKMLGKVMTLQFESRLSNVGGLIAGMGRALVITALFLFALFFVPDPFVKQQIYGNSWWGQRAIDATPRWYARISALIKESEQSARAMSAHYELEKERMHQKLSERREQLDKQGREESEPAGASQSYPAALVKPEAEKEVAP